MPMVEAKLAAVDADYTDADVVKLEADLDALVRKDSWLVEQANMHEAEVEAGDRCPDTVFFVKCRRSVHGHLMSLAQNSDDIDGLLNLETKIKCQTAIATCLCPALRHSTKNSAATKSHIEKAREAMTKSMDKAAKRAGGAEKPAGKKRKGGNKYALADSDPKVLQDLELFPGHLHISTVRAGNVDNVYLQPGNPFIYRLTKGKDPLKVLFPEDDCREFLLTHINNFKAAFSAKAIVKAAQALPLCPEVTAARTHLGTLAVEHSSKLFPDFNFKELAAISPDYDVALSMWLAGFKMNELSMGVDNANGLGTLRVQVQGTRLMAIGNPHAIKQSYNSVNGLASAIQWLENVSVADAPSPEIAGALHVGVVLPGDVLYVPMGSIVVEKALNADNIALRMSVPTVGTFKLLRAFKMLMTDTAANPMMNAIAGLFTLPDHSDDDKADSDSDSGSSSSSSVVPPLPKKTKIADVKSGPAIADAPPRPGTVTPICRSAGSPASVRTLSPVHVFPAMPNLDEDIDFDEPAIAEADHQTQQILHTTRTLNTMLVNSQALLDLFEIGPTKHDGEPM